MAKMPPPKRQPAPRRPPVEGGKQIPLSKQQKRGWSIEPVNEWPQPQPKPKDPGGDKREGNS